MGSCKELGSFKTKFATSLRNSEAIKILLLGKDYQAKADAQNLDVDEMLDKYIFSHLFVEGTVTKTESYIFYDVVMPKFGSSVKNVRVFVYAISHRDILDNFTSLTTPIRRNYTGNRADKMAQAIEEIFCEDETVARDFGIGKLDLADINIYNSDKFYGRILTFEVPNFR